MKIDFHFTMKHWADVDVIIFPLELIDLKMCLYVEMALIHSLSFILKQRRFFWAAALNIKGKKIPVEYSLFSPLLSG